MTQYLLSVHMVEGEEMPSDDVMQQMFADVDAVNADMQAQGVWVFGGGLTEPDIATVVQQRDGEIVMTDGPFVEAKEHIGGFWIIEVADLDAALGWAKRATVACQGPVEVRPFQDEPGA